MAWSLIEVAVGTIAACLPTLGPLVGHIWRSSVQHYRRSTSVPLQDGATGTAAKRKSSGKPTKRTTDSQRAASSSRWSKRRRHMLGSDASLFSGHDPAIGPQRGYDHDEAYMLATVGEHQDSSENTGPGSEPGSLKREQSKDSLMEQGSSVTAVSGQPKF